MILIHKFLEILQKEDTICYKTQNLTVSFSAYSFSKRLIFRDRFMFQNDILTFQNVRFVNYSINQTYLLNMYVRIKCLYLRKIITLVVTFK